MKNIKKVLLVLLGIASQYKISTAIAALALITKYGHPIMKFFRK